MCVKCGVCRACKGGLQVHAECGVYRGCKGGLQVHAECGVCKCAV